MNDKGKVSVGKVRQNDLAFRMNASSREVLRKCLKGIIITEPDVRRRRIVDEEAPKRRGFRAGVDLRLGAIDTTNVTELEGEKEKNNRKSPKQYQ